MTVSANDGAFFSTNGYLIVPNLIDPDMLERVLKIAGEVSLGDRWHPDWNDEGVRGLQQLRDFSYLLEESRKSDLVSRAHAIAEALMGQDMVLWADQMIMKPGGCDVHVAWHQDASYWCNWTEGQSLPEGHCLKDHVGLDMAPLCYLPGTHRHRFPHGEVKLATNEYNKKDPLYVEPESIAPYLESLVRCPLNAGDCVFHDARLVHGSESNTSTRPRYGLVMHFWRVTGWDVKARELSRKEFFQQQPAA